MSTEVYFGEKLSIMEKLRVRRGYQIAKQYTNDHINWFNENGVTAIYIPHMRWGFENEEDAIAFKLKFGL